MAEKIIVDLTSPEHSQASAMGKVLNKLFYSSKHEDLLNLIDNVGSPHSGGQHHLTIKGSRPDVMSWLSIFLETFPEVEPEIKEIQRLIMKESLKALFHYKVELSEIQREFKYKGRLLNRPWFWTHAQEDETHVN